MWGRRRRFEDIVKMSLKTFEIDPATWHYAALNHPCRPSHITSGVVVAGEKRTAEVRRKRLHRKQRAIITSTTVTAAPFICSISDSHFQASSQASSKTVVIDGSTIWPWQSEDASKIPGF